MKMGEDFRPMSPELGDIHLMDGSLDDFLDLAVAAEAPEASPRRYAPSNAVHMEVQANAKLPTLTMNVDRSNSSVVLPRQSQQASSPTTKRTVTMP